MRRERRTVTNREAVGPYTLLRVDRGGLDPGAPGQFFMLEAPGRLLPRPSGPVTWISSPTSSDAIAVEPAPSGSTRKPSSPAGAVHRLNGRGSGLPGASSMKNCPGAPG